MSNALNLTIRYEDAGDGWLTAQVAEVPGAISEGKTREEGRWLGRETDRDPERIALAGVRERTGS
jgi:hypothetical protein